VKILRGEFVTSIATGGSLPPSERTVVALVGRSNVGKSSLINALVKRRVARAGTAPGVTRLLNVYRVCLSGGSRGNKSLTLVDLPGYGYARGGEQARHNFNKLTTEFFTEMVQPPTRLGSSIDTARLAGAILVVDSRHPGLDSDLAAHSWLINRHCPLVVVATKIDQLKRSIEQRVTRDHEIALGCDVLRVSSKTGDGIKPLWTALTRLVADLL
jgi:GTP-binding protein